MSNAVHVPRLAIVLLATLVLAACSKGENHDSAHSGPSSSSAGLPTGHVAAGEQLAKAKGKATGQSCIDCHGADGNAPIDPSYPKLGGQYADYIEHSLVAYRSGDRGGSTTTDLMASQAKELTDQQIADLAAYYGSVQGQLRDLHNAN